jgi:hypothetical protein
MENTNAVDTHRLNTSHFSTRNPTSLKFNPVDKKQLEVAKMVYDQRKPIAPAKKIKKSKRSPRVPKEEKPSSLVKVEDLAQGETYVGRVAGDEGDVALVHVKSQNNSTPKQNRSGVDPLKMSVVNN